MEDPPDSMHLNDATTSTPTTTYKYIAYSGEAKEYVVKFLFQPKTNKNTEVARTHYAILQAVSQIFPDIVIYDNDGMTMKSFSSIMTYHDYLRHFKLHFMKGNESKRRSAIYMAFHCILSKIPISEIRRHLTISGLLQKVNTRITVYHWSEEDTRISNLGFFLATDPGNVIEDEFLELVKTQIHTATKQPIRKIPKFKCSLWSPFILDNDGNCCSTKAYDLQCRQQDAKELLGLLKETYKHNPKFIFHKVRHSHPELYYRAIVKQNSFLKNSCIVPIQGISRELMYYLDLNIRQVDGVTMVSWHKTTDSAGRWNVHTTASNFQQVSKTLQDHLAQWAAHHIEEQRLDLSHMPCPPQVAFRTTPYDKSSPGGSYDTWITTCTSVLSAAAIHDPSDHLHNPPTGSSLVLQAWSSPVPVPTVIEMTAQSSSPSSQTHKELDRMRAENAQLRRDMQELRDQLRQLCSARAPPPAS